MLALVSNASHPIRPFVLHRDLSALADLIEAGFADELAATGSHMVTELRAMATWGLIPLRTLGLTRSLWEGLVWVEGERLVGNVTMVPEGRGIWSLSNVAVRPEDRGRGIGGALVDAALEELRRRGARHVILYVRPDNGAAVRLYQRRGFDTYDRVHELSLRAHAWPAMVAGAMADVRRPRKADAPSVRTLLEESMPQQARTFHPVRPQEWQRGIFRDLCTEVNLMLKGQDRLDLVTPRVGEPMGLIRSTVRLLGPYHDLAIYVSPAARGQVERTLIDALFIDLGAAPRRGIHATVSVCQIAAVQELERTGFETLRFLDRMALTLR